MIKRKRAKVQITEEMLSYLLFGTMELKIEDLKVNKDKNIVYVYVSGDKLDPLNEGDECPAYAIDQLVRKISASVP